MDKEDSRALFYEPVKKIRTSKLLSELYEESFIPSHLEYAIVKGSAKKGTAKILNFCSEVYSLVSNRDLCLPYEGELEKLHKRTGLTFNLKYKVEPSGVFYMDVILANQKIEITKGDIILPKIRFINSYNGKVRFGVSMGYYRIHCKNGLSLPPTNLISHQEVTHTINMATEAEVQHLINLTSNFSTRAADIAKGYKPLIRKEVVLTHAVKLMELASKKTKFPVGLIYEARERWDYERKYIKTKPTYWLVYNCLNYALNHSRYKLEGYRRAEIDQEVLALLLKS
jgi:hypothetical protein